MLFSNPMVAQFLNDRFECAWLELRPVPQVKIDFGNGRTLRRTLAGNVATWICMPNGSAIDVVPALATVATYQGRLKQSLELYANVAKLDPVPRREALRLWHQKRSAQKVIPFPPKPAVKRIDKLPAGLKFLSKSGVERPIKQSFLARDDTYNRWTRAPLAHRILSLSPGLTPAELTPTIFKSVLNVDLQDPYLGLAPYVLGGEPGRG